jgi:hypothetical protein
MSSTIPLPPQANSFVIGSAVINTHTRLTGKREREPERERENFIRNYP